MVEAGVGRRGSMGGGTGGRGRGEREGGGGGATATQTRRLDETAGAYISYCEDSPAAPQDEPACACNANVNASKLHVSMGVELAGLLLGIFGSMATFRPAVFHGVVLPVHPFVAAQAAQTQHSRLAHGPHACIHLRPASFALQLSAQLL